MVNVAIIGVGNIAETHLLAYSKNKNVKVVAFCDINPDRLQYMGKKWGVDKCFTDLNEMFSNVPEIDAVSVCTWNSAHAPCTIAALKAGKHVLCEKPMAMNAQEANEMLATAKECGKLLMIGFVRRHGNDAKIVREFVDSDYFGELYYAKATYLRRNGNPGGWFGDRSRSGGGPLIDLGVHVIDLVRFIFGNPKPISVYGATFTKLHNRPDIKSDKGYRSAGAGEADICNVEDLASAMIRFDNGAVLSVEAAFSLNLKKDEGKIELFGTKGGAKLDPELELYGEMNGYMTNMSLANIQTALSFDGLFENEIDHYIDCIEGRAACIAPAEDGVTLMKILDGIYESARLGHEVLL
ncbi:MAG: Gfo/Idh/MocA family oxidoreductase [Clostridia bacterium]|nr:Gfo/Idh/MocA family oxidoreductase [Clostridia bacterium]